LRTRPGVAGGKFYNEFLGARRERVCVADQRVEFRGAQVITALGIVTPTVRRDVSAGADGVTRQALETWRRFVTAQSIKNSLHNKARARRDAKAVKRTEVVDLTRGTVSGNDSCDM